MPFQALNETIAGHSGCMARQRAAGPQDPVAAAAAELYGLPPGEFTAARNDRAKQARASGDADAAAAIRKLARPSVVAWLANQLARVHADEVRELLDVGAAMRHATAALDVGQLRKLSSRRQQVVRSLLAQARDLASANGQALTDATARDLESTLHAALADEQAASALSGGQLTAALSYTGFPGVEPGAVGPPSAARRAGAPRDQPRRDEARKGAAPQGAAPQDEARQDEARARAEAQAAAHATMAAAERARTAARATLNDAEQAARDAADSVRRLRSELDAALAELADAGRAERQARKGADIADRAAHRAEQRLSELTVKVSDA